MLSADGKHLYVSEEEYLALTEKLAVSIHLSGWRFDAILTSHAMDDFKAVAAAKK